MRDSQEELIYGDLKKLGWSLLLPPVSSCAEDIALTLGPLVQNQRTGLPYVDLVPHSKSDAPLGSMSSLVGTAAQPMHSDGAHTSAPPHYLVFKCLDTGNEQCLTHIWAIDFETVIAKKNPLLMAPQWVFGMKNQGFYSAIIQRKLSANRIRFDPLCMSPAAFSHSSLAEAESSIGSCSQKFSIDWTTGAILIMITGDAYTPEVLDRSSLQAAN